MFLKHLRRITIAWLLGKLARTSAAGLLGAAVLGWVADHTQPDEGTAFVHVTEPDVQVSIGDRTYTVAGTQLAPIECGLPPGRHTLVMSRLGEVLYREDFEVSPGSQVILTAWQERAGTPTLVAAGAARANLSTGYNHSDNAGERAGE
ncbi:MAG TPA: hypothetical protein VGZ22_13780 [Isosphaeraceae bacterium]|jgi:hypothetical protein|nr:hypothetical protein [Isosphaeraceae bacterium]